MSKAVKILGLLGHQVDYSLSPLLHNTAIDHLGLNYYYTIFNIASSEELEDVLNGMRAMGIAGFNVTIPYKERVIKYLDQLSPAASEIQAVNTILNQDGQLIGHNTDSYGFSEPLQTHAKLIKGGHVAIFGNGGAARAAIHALRSYFEPASIHIISRTVQRGEELKRDMLRQSTRITIDVHQQEDPETFELLKTCTLVVNATPLGTKKTGHSASSADAQTLIPDDMKLWTPQHIIYDLVYNPFYTPFLIQAREQGATVINGIGMLIAQASQSFKLWTGHDMPLFNVKHAIIKRLENNLI